jgi:hypothetical protein
LRGVSKDEAAELENAWLKEGMAPCGAIPVSAFNIRGGDV